MLCHKLRQCRELCDYSQQQVADCLNVNRSTYSYYELGKTEPSIDNLRLLARLFGVPLDYLLADDSAPLTVHDRPVSEFDDPELPELPETHIGELEKDEKKLVMLYRLMSDEQRQELIASLSDQNKDEGKK